MENQEQQQQQPPHLSPFASMGGSLHVRLHAVGLPDSSGCGIPRAYTPLKRSRADVQQRISGDLARTGCELPVDEVVDHVRTQKRFVSESMAADMSRMNVALGPGVHVGAQLRRDSNSGSGSGGQSPMECFSPPNPRLQFQEADISGAIGEGLGFNGAASPAFSDCFNPFASPRRRSTEGFGAFSAEMVSPQRTPQSQTERNMGFLSPTASKSRFGRLTGVELNERLPPSPSDPQIGMDLRKAALLRSLLMRTEEKSAPVWPRVPSPKPDHMEDLQAADFPNLQTEEERQQRLTREPSGPLRRRMSPSDMSLGESGSSSSSEDDEVSNHGPLRFSSSTAHSAFYRSPSTTLFNCLGDFSDLQQNRGEEGETRPMVG